MVIRFRDAMLRVRADKTHLDLVSPNHHRPEPREHYRGVETSVVQLAVFGGWLC